MSAAVSASLSVNDMGSQRRSFPDPLLSISGAPVYLGPVRRAGAGTLDEEEGFASTSVARAITERRPYIHAAAAAIFVAATFSAIVSHAQDMPRTAAVIYLLGVTLVGAMEGLWGGLVAAFLASLVYNFLLSDPIFRFSLTSPEEYIPLIAFNLSAAASGLLAGSLRDRALAAERANRRMRLLFAVSRNLQAAVTLSDVPAAVASYAGDDEAPEIYVVSGEGLAPIQPSSRHGELARRLYDSGRSMLSEGRHRALPLSIKARPIGVIVLDEGSEAIRRPGQHDLQAFVNLTSIALERCLLLEQVSEAELIKRSEEFKTALLSSVSHDMRTPLSAIAASASGLASFGRDLPEDTRNDLLNMIQEQCERLNRYTGNLLNLTRLQAGLDASQFTECDAIEVLGSAIAHVRRLAAGRRIEKCYEAETALVRADPAMLEQVYYNVLENALRYSPPEAPVRVIARSCGSTLYVSIKDSGHGIPAADRSRIFDRFYRTRAAQAQEGSGLGLSIAKGFTEAFGGSIDARQPDSGAGTTIRIALPLLRDKRPLQ